MAWIYLAIAGVLEIVWAISIKYSKGFSKLWPSIITVIAMIGSFRLLSSAIKIIPIGTGYAVWTGIGAAGTAVIGMILFGESRELVRIFCIVFIVAGVVGLKLFSGSGH